jgi:hypothetical protein
VSDAVATDTRLLPAEFADLEPWAAIWSLPSLNQRHDQRMASTMAELQEFYDVMLPRIEPAIEHLNQFPVDDLPDDARNLFWLLCSVSMMSFAVDVFKQPKVPDSGEGNIPVVIEPGP